MSFYENVIKHYLKIKFPKEYSHVCRVDGPNSWYFADYSSQFICVNGVLQNRNLLEVDIKSAFPTICNVLLSNIMPDFLIQMNNIKDKKEKNIFIATQLKSTPYLKQLHRLSKIIILGYIFDSLDSENILLLELKKDGCIILIDDYNYDNIKFNERPFVKFLIDHNFIFHNSVYLKYIRSNKTSTLFYEHENKYKLSVKGQYKYLPKKIIDTNIKILSDEHIDLTELNKIYSSDYYNIIKQNNLIELFQNYYLCSNNKILEANGIYNKISLNNNINPRLYLETFIFPIILSEKIF